MRFIKLSISLLCLVFVGKAYPINFDPNWITVQSNKITYPYAKSLFMVNSISMYQQGIDDSLAVKGPCYKNKNPWLAFGLALGPGIVVHGLGHYYAGRKKTALILFGTEILATGLAFIERNQIRKENSRRVDAPLLGVYLFSYLYASWMYDVIFAPSKIIEDNKKH
jgi:hypothetical protein